MRAHRKLGEAHYTVIILVIAALSIAVLFFIFLRVKDITAGAADKNCAAQAREMDLTNRFTSRDFVNSIKGCQTEFKTIEASKYPQDSAEKELKRVMAEEMRQCWSDWGKGELELFDETGTFCHVCTRVHFDFKNKQVIPLNNFNTYLAETRSPEGATYAEALAGAVSENTGVEIKNLGAQAYTVDTSKDQLIMFVYAKYPASSNIYGLIFGDDATTPLFTGVAGGVIGATAVAAIGLSGGAVLVAAAGGALVTGVIDMVRGEEYYTFSAIYITPDDAGSYYAQQCEEMASATESP